MSTYQSLSAAIARLGGLPALGLMCRASLGILVCLWAIVLQAPIVQAAEGDSERSQHIFVIDHSTSMLNQSGYMTRWDFVHGKTKEWLETLPADGSADVTILLFNQFVPGRSPISSRGGSWVYTKERWVAADARKAMDFIDDVGEPISSDGSHPGEGTALWNALGHAMRQVQQSASSYAESWIYLFTDGEDTASEKKKKDPFTFNSGDSGKEPLLVEWRKLVKKRDATYMIEQPLGDMEPPLEPEVERPENVHIYTSRPELRDSLRVRVATAKASYPALDVPQTVDLQVQIAGTGKKRLPQSAQFGLSFVPDDNSIRVDVDPPVLTLQDGKVAVTLKTSGGDAKRGVTGTLRIRFPTDLDRMDVIGPDSLALSFAAKAQVAISSVKPAESLKWPLSKPLEFGVKHTGTSAKWDFGDGSPVVSQESGVHKFATTGRFDVQVTAEAAGLDPATAKVRVEVVAADVPVTFTPDKDIVVGTPVVFLAKPFGLEATYYDWRVDGYARNPDTSSGEQLTVRFEKEGEHVVDLIASTDLCEITKQVKVVVGPGLGLRIAPDYKATVDAGEQYDFSAIIDGGSGQERVRFELLGSDGASLLSGVAPQQGVLAGWKAEIPLNAPPKIKLRASVDMDDAQRAKFGGDRVDEVELNVRPPGLYMSKVRPTDGGYATFGTNLEMAAEWSGSASRKVERVRWSVMHAGRELDVGRDVQANQSEKGRSSAFVLTIPFDKALLGATLDVAAMPLMDGRPDADHAVRWTLPLKLPSLDYRIQTESLSLGRLDFGRKMQVRLMPVDLVESIDWDWGDNKLQSSKPSESLEHEYGFDAAGVVQLRAVARLVDGSAVPVSLSFEHYVPAFSIKNPGAVRISRDVELEIIPGLLEPYVAEVKWDFGAGTQEPETDLKTSFKFSKPGVSQVRATVRLRNGSTRELPSIGVNVTASDEVRGEVSVDGAESHGAVNIQTTVGESFDYTSIEVEVYRDGSLLHTKSGAQVAYAMVEGEFGTYTHKVYAQRVPTAGNPAPRLLLGEITRVYADRKPIQAYSVLIGSMLLAAFVCWAMLLYQHPRHWKIYASTRNPNDYSDPEETQDAVSWRLGNKKGTLRRWGAFKARKWMDVTASDMAWLATQGSDVAPNPLEHLRGNANRLRVSARGDMAIATLHRDEWDDQRHNVESSTRIYSMKAPESLRRGGAGNLYVWLQDKDRSPVPGLITSVVILVAVYMVNHWHMSAICQMF